MVSAVREPLPVLGLDRPLPRLVQGTLHLPHLDPEQVNALLDAALELGVTAFDTAPVYGNGAAERLLGAWLEARRVRDRVLLIGKGCHPDGSRPRLDARSLRDDLSRSLERLRVDVIDLYLLHRDDPAAPVEPVVEALNGELAAGRLRAFGASNWSWSRIGEANAFAARSGLRGFSLSSPGLSLVRAHRTWPGCLALSLPLDASEVERYRETRFPVLVWSPLAGGYLAHASGPLGADPGQAKRALEFYDSPESRARRRRAVELAEARGVGVPVIALAYALSLGLAASCVVGCRDRAELVECRRALELELTSEQRRWLESGAPRDDRDA